MFKITVSRTYSTCLSFILKEHWTNISISPMVTCTEHQLQFLDQSSHWNRQYSCNMSAV